MGLVLSIFIDEDNREQALKKLSELSKEELLSKLEVTSSYLSSNDEKTPSLKT